MLAVKLASLVLAGSVPFSLTLAPGKMTAQPGGQQHLRIFDTGKTPATVVMAFREIQRDATGICTITTQPVTWARADPAAFTLTPGKNKLVTITIAHTASPGRHDLAIEATSVVTHGGNIKLNALLVSQALVTFPGPVLKHQPAPCLAVTAPRHQAAAALSVPLIGGAALAAVAALLAGWAFLLRARHRQAAAR